MSPVGRRTPSRRADAAAGRPAVLGLMLVGLTVGLLTLAGTTPVGIGRPVDDVSRVRLDTRTFTCTGGIADTLARSGNIVDGLAKDTALDAPTPLVADQDVARGAFAAQQAGTSRTLAWLPCPEARARWWFVAAGGATVSHDSVVTVTNPRQGAAVIDIDVYGPKGVVEAPGLHGITVAAGASRTFDLARTAPSVGNLAVSVVAKRGLIAASAVDRFSIGGIGTTVREWLPPQTLPATSVTLAGLPANPDSAVLVVANPHRSEAIASVTAIGATGTFTPKALQPFKIAPFSVVALPVSVVLDGTPMALQVTSTRRLTATVRSVQSGDIAFATGVQVIRGGTAFAVPTGSGRVVLSSVGAAGEVRYVAYDAAGTVLVDKPVKVGEKSSVAVKLPAKASYVGLTSTTGDIVAGFAVTAGKGLATAGVSAAIRSIRLPAIRPGS